MNLKKKSILKLDIRKTLQILLNVWFCVENPTNSVATKCYDAITNKLIRKLNENEQIDQKI